MTEEERLQQAEEKAQREAERKLLSERKKEHKRLAVLEQRAARKALKLEKKVGTGTKNGTKTGSDGKWKGKESAEGSGPQINGQDMRGTTPAMGDQSLAYVHNQYGSDDLGEHRVDIIRIGNVLN